MKSFIRLLKSHKYISLIASCLLVFSIVGVSRGYIFDFIYKSDNMTQIGAPWLNVTAFVESLTAVGALLGDLN